MASGKTIFKKNGEIVSRKVAGELILVPVQGELANMQRIFALDEVADCIWEQLDGEKNLDEILSNILDMFGVERKKAREDLMKFIEELQGAGLICEVK